MSGRIDLKSWCTMCLFLLGIGCTTAAGRIIYVDVDGNGLNNGSSWADAYTYLQNALADANSATKPVEIRVADGIYTPDSNSANPNGTGDRTATFQLVNGVTLQGGYAGFDALDPNGRDVELYETILSGDLDGNDVDVNDPCDLLSEPSRAENSYHVVTGSGGDATAVLDGFTIEGGNANGYPETSGGGMYNYGGSPTVINCAFRENKAEDGGGMCNEGPEADVTLVNCMFIRNSASIGGGMGNWLWCSPILINCTFSGNSAEYGAGMCNGEVWPILTNCIFWGAGEQILNADWQITITYSDVRGGYPGEGNIDAAPCFADANKGDYHLKSQAGRWDPNSQTWIIDANTSPCIDAGNPSSPIGFEGFPNGGIINMGAYGGTIEASKSYFGGPVCETIVAGDINGDCRVDFADLALMGLHWLECTAPECETVIEVSTTTDKSTYLLGEEVTVFVTAYNPNAEPVTLGAGFYFASYIMDGVYDWAEGRSAPAVITSMTIEPHDSYTWELKHGSYEMGVYPLNVGSHTVIGEVLRYGQSAPVEFEVRSE